MKKVILLLSVICFIQSYAQEKEQTSKVKFSGYIKTDMFYDTRQTVSSREGHFLLYPAPVKDDAFGNDLNAVSNFNMLSIQTRLTTSFYGPEVMGIKTSGLIEGEFFGHSNTDINGFRLRHALIKLNSAGTEVLLGQYWHPMFVPEVSSGAISFNTGAPFQAFSRNPQLRITQAIGHVNLIAALLSQRDFSSPGPGGSSSQYLRNAALPNLHLQLQLKNENLVAGFGGDYKKIMPRTETVKGVKTSETLGSLAAIGYLKMNISAITIKAYGSYGENLADMLMLGGYAVKSADTTSGRETYTNMKAFSAWSDLSFGKDLAFGLFLGYTKNLGTNDAIAGQVFSSTGNIDRIFRVSPRVQWRIDNLNFTSELEVTSASFGTPDKMGLVKNTVNAVNTRILLAAYYYFEF